MRFAKVAFTIAGVYGIAVLAPPLFLESKFNHDYPPPVTHPEFFYGFFALGLTWQFLFLLIATDPIKYRAMMIPSTLEKLGYPVAIIFLHFQGRIDPRMFALGSLDWIFLILVAISYKKTQPH